MSSTPTRTSLKDALKNRSDISQKIELSLEMIENEDIIEAFLSDNRDRIRGYSHVRLDSQLQKLCLVEKANIKFEMKTKFVQWKTQKKIPGVGIGIQVTDHYEKLHCVLDEQHQAVVSDIALSRICKVKPNLNLFSKIGQQSKSYTDLDMLDGVEIGGITNSTVQLSSKGSNIGDHTEHYGLASLNVHHYGGPKIWFIKPSDKFIPAMMKMAELSEKAIFPKGIVGVCGLNLTHRDLQYNPSLLGIDYETVVQEKGDILCVHPSSIHSIFNQDHNLAESRNILPQNQKYLHHIASYKVCCHSEALTGKPAQNEFRNFIKDCNINEYIHFSDPSKAYKLDLIRCLRQKQCNQQYIPEVMDQIKRSNVVLKLFNFLLPYQKIIPECDKKKFKCTECSFSCNFYGNLNRHSLKMHRHKAPINTNKDMCPICDSTSHFKCKKKTM